MAQPLHGASGPEPGDAALRLVMRRERGGAVLAVEPVPPRALVDAVAELWFDTCLRRGRPELGLGEVRAQLRPIYREHAKIGRYCAGFSLSNGDASGPASELLFDRECLEHLTVKRARQLIEEGRLEADSSYSYSLEPVAPQQTLRGPEGRGAPELLRRPLDSLLARVEETRGDVEDHFPVFYTRAALERAERISRKGAEARPPVETGGLLDGPLGVCPRSGEVFAVVADVLEATEAEATTYSLAYAGPTWARIQAILRARQAHPPMRTYRVLGQAHGHNFHPLGGAAPCEMCERLPVCTQSSAWLSSEDRAWTRAHFSAEPWQLSHLFGLDARYRPVESFWGQRGGELVRRGYHVIDDFDPNAQES